MKKNGFTLAEVLITLGIIGFIASLTLPSVTSSTKERQAAVALKKGINTLTTAANMSSALNGTDFQSINNMSEIRTLLKATTNTKSVIQDGASTELETNGVANSAVFFRDGTALVYDNNLVIQTSHRKTLSDGLAAGIPVLFDINGEKGPNQTSSCTTQACDSRIINDQFAIKLRGTVVVPNDYASRWLVEQ